jgi:catechol 2,3-dioxygenase-like lactoylglutathione lyase family enzyme
VSLVLTVEDCDAAVERALTQGATLERGPTDEEHGARTAWILDPSGHRWSLQAPALVEAGGDTADALQAKTPADDGYTITRA